MLRWRIARDTGWTFAQIENLSLEDVWAYLSIEDGNRKTSESLARKTSNRRLRRRKR